MNSLATVRSSLEEHEKLLREVEANGQRLRDEVAAAAAAFKQAEPALEEAERRLAASISKPQQASQGMALSPPPCPQPANALSTRGVEALKALEGHIQGLTSEESLANIEKEYQEIQEQASGTPVPDKLAFVLGRIQREGVRQLQAICFELPSHHEVPGPATEAAHVATGPVRREARLYVPYGRLARDPLWAAMNSAA